MSALISFRIDCLVLRAVQWTPKSVLQHHSSKASVLWPSAFFMVQLSHPYMTTGKTTALTRRNFAGSNRYISDTLIPVLCLVAQLCPTRGNPMHCSSPGSSVHGDSPGKNTGVGCHALLQRIFPNQGSNPGLPHCRPILYQLSHQGSHILSLLYWVWLLLFLFSGEVFFFKS